MAHRPHAAFAVLSGASARRLQRVLSAPLTEHKNRNRSRSLSKKHPPLMTEKTLKSGKRAHLWGRFLPGRDGSDLLFFHKKTQRSFFLGGLLLYLSLWSHTGSHEWIKSFRIIPTYDIIVHFTLYSRSKSTALPTRIWFGLLATLGLCILIPGLGTD